MTFKNCPVYNTVHQQYLNQKNNNNPGTQESKQMKGLGQGWAGLGGVAQLFPE